MSGIHADCNPSRVEQPSPATILMLTQYFPTDGVLNGFESVVLVSDQSFAGTCVRPGGLSIATRLQAGSTADHWFQDIRARTLVSPELRVPTRRSGNPSS